jgi:hypothetical protein
VEGEVGEGLSRRPGEELLPQMKNQMNTDEEAMGFGTNGWRAGRTT